VLQDQAFVIGEAVKKRFFRSIDRFKIGMEVLLNDLRVFVYHIVISPYQVKPVVEIKKLQELVYVLMRLKQGFELKVFPKFIPITQFYIMKPVIEILFQRMEIDIPVVGEFICKTIIPPVAVTKKYKFGIVIERDSRCIGIGPVQTFGRSHK
jgi:hypothetical protein